MKNCLYGIYYKLLLDMTLFLSNSIKHMSKSITKFAIYIVKQAKKRCIDDY